MNYEELNALLAQANEHNITCNYTEAEKLAQQVLSEVLLKGEGDSARQGDENRYHPEPFEGLVDGSKMTGEQKQLAELRVYALLTLYASALQKSDYKLALALAQNALALATEHTLPSFQAKALGNIGNVHLYLSDYPLALEYYAKALTCNEYLGNKDGIARLLGNIGNVHYSLSDYPLALEYYAKALALAEDLGNKAGMAIHLGNIGVVNWNLSDYPLALEYYAKALALDEELGNKAGAAKHLGNIGLVHQYLSDYPRALEYYAKALALDQELGNKAGVAIRLGNIGVVHLNLCKYSLALDYFKKALALDEKLGNKVGVARHLGSIGDVHYSLSDDPLALENYVKALALDEELGNKAGVARHLGNIGDVHQNLSDFDKGLEYLFRAMALAAEIGNKDLAAHFQVSIGELYANPDFAGCDDTKAEKYLLEAIALSKELGTKKYSLRKSLADLYKRQKRWEECQLQFEKYHEIYLEVQSEEATKQAQLMEHRRKIEEAERDRQVKLARFQEQEKILHNILPSQIANRMIEGEKTIADTHENVSVFFSDIVGFTKLSQQVSAQELVGMLNGIFSQFDQIARKHGLEKIKTIGDAYMAVCGAPISMDNHAERTALFALDVAELMNNYHTESLGKVSVRIGLHSGSVVAGIIGENKFAYDMWGDAVNTASRMESHGEPGKIHVTEEFKHAVETLHATSLQLHATSLQFIRRGEMEIKGKGMMKTYFLEKI